MQILPPLPHPSPRLLIHWEGSFAAASTNGKSRSSVGFVVGFCREKARETERGKTHGGKLRKQLIEVQKIDNKVQMKTGYQRKL